MTALAPRLLACPFCGSDAEMDTDQSFRAFVSGRFESSVAIYCTKCCVQMQHCYSDHRGTEREDLAADLIERWNTREVAAALSVRVPEGDMALALAWVREIGMRNAPFHVAAIEEAIAAYDPERIVARTAPAADGWRPIADAPKSAADGSRVTGVYLLGFNFDPDLDFDPQACIDIIWWEPLLPNNAGGRGKWCRQAEDDAIECAPTHWMPLPAAPQAQGEE